jgi:DNA-binding transcriptional LysR family regulator
MVVEAAVLGLGVALARASLVADEIASGRLVTALPHAAPTACAYYLLCRPEAAACPRFICFRDWLVEECEPRPRAELPRRLSI